jgi:outer membrane protein, heavy metal efflux system
MKLDSIYLRISGAAKRQFDAGQIDFMQSSFADAQYQQVHIEYQASVIRHFSLMNQLKLRTGITDSILSEKLSASKEVKIGSFNYLNSPRVKLYQESIFLQKKNLGLARNKALPGLAFGYFNQAGKEVLVLPFLYGSGNIPGR